MLSNLDDAHRVIYSSQFVRRLTLDVNALMRKLQSDIESMEPAFKGTMVPAGSFYNQTKIDLPNEFDFIFEWDLETNPLIFIEKVEGPFGYSDCFRVHLRTISNPDQFFWPHLIPRRWEQVLDTCLGNRGLAGCWAHGGYLSPRSSGVRHNGAALMIQLIYNHNRKPPLELTIDLVIAVKIQKEIARVFSPIHGPQPICQYLFDSDIWSHVWFKFPDWKFDQTIAQSRWLGIFPENHPVKVTIRVLKIINHLAARVATKDMLYDDPYPENREREMKETQDALTSMRDFKQSRKSRLCMAENTSYVPPVTQVQMYDICHPDRYSFHDIGEHTGVPPYIRSHTIQSLVLGFLAIRCLTSPSENPLLIWDTNSVFDVGVCVLGYLKAYLCHPKIPSCLHLGDMMHTFTVPESAAKSTFLYKEQVVLEHLDRMMAELCRAAEVQSPGRPRIPSCGQPLCADK